MNVPVWVMVAVPIDPGAIVPVSNTPAVSDVAVCGAVSSLTQLTVLLTPITTVRESGENPNCAGDPAGGTPAPAGMVTFTALMLDDPVEVVVVDSLKKVGATWNWK